MNPKFTIITLIFFISCYKESDYHLNSDKSNNLFKVNVDKSVLLADNFSTVQITVEFDDSVDSTKAITIFKTTAGKFIESNSTTYKVTPKFSSDYSKLITSVKLQSPLIGDSAQITVQVASFTKSIVIKFNKSYPENLSLSANTLAVKPKNNSEGEVIFTNKIFKSIGFPTTNILVDLEVLDSTLLKKIGSFRTYENKTDLIGITTYTYVLGDSIANGVNYLGKLYAISKVQTSDEPLTFKRDTLIFISSK